MTPLEQIKERIEALKMRDDLKKDTRTCPVHMIDERIAYNEGLREGFDVVIENLPSIIQEVEDAVAASYDNAELGYRPKLLSNTATEPSLKEESKYE